MERVLPDGSMELVINLEEDLIKVYDQKNQDRFKSFRGSVISGPHADFTVIEEANELLQRLEEGTKLPLFTSCCPAWFNYVQKMYPEFEGHLSSTKSPNEMLGSLVKHFFEKQG